MKLPDRTKDFDMASSLNKVILIGRLGKDPEQRFTGNGTPVCNFTLATNEYDGKDDSGQTKERTEWHDIVAYSKLAEICNQYLAKGRQVYVEGRLQTRKWEDKQTGEPRRKTEIVARDIVLLGSREGGGRDMGEDRGSYSRGGGGGGGGGQRRGAPPPKKAAEDYSQDEEDSCPPPEDDVPF
jgi:single-strand DNA-binding protein